MPDEVPAPPILIGVNPFLVDRAFRPCHADVPLGKLPVRGWEGDRHEWN